MSKELDCSKPFVYVPNPSDEVKFVGRGWNGYLLFEVRSSRMVFRTDSWGHNILNGQQMVENLIPNVTRYLWISTANDMIPQAENASYTRSDEVSYTHNNPGKSAIHRPGSHWFKVEINPISGDIVKMEKLCQNKD